MKLNNNTAGHYPDTLIDKGIVTYFRQALIEWYELNGRRLPWRETNDPYKIWISEVILQQTQVIQGLDYYLRFIERYPDVKTLAASPESDLLLIWQGLGYYSRAHNLHKAAQSIVQYHSGVFPKAVEDVSKLKGIGPYTLAAIMSIAYNEPLAVVDGNVYRVLSRVLDIDVPIDTSMGQKAFRALAQELLDPQYPGIYNQGIMDLGAMICTPKSPKCDECPIQEVCKCAHSPTITLRPVKAKKMIVKELYLDFFLLIQGEYIWGEKRGKQSIWKGLYQFPLHLSDRAHPAPLSLLRDLKINTGEEELKISHSYTTTHRLTHRLLNINIHTIHLPEHIDLSYLGLEAIPISRHSEYAFPKPLREFLDKNLK